MTSPRVPFTSLGLHEDAANVRAAIDRVVASGWFVLGPEVEAFEAEFAAASGAPYAVGVGCGTDAIALVLRGLGVGPGDEVITTAVSAAYTALAVLTVGARPIFADIDPDRMTVDPASVAAAITARTRAILPVHLYGQVADLASLEQLASRHNLAIIEDCCQAHLAAFDGCPVGTVGVAGAFSFYPTKNLGALGDGGAVITKDRQLAERIGRLRNGGQSDRYRHQEAGINSRLDELQAAILRARLPFLREWTGRRRALADAYRTALRGAPVRVVNESKPGDVHHLFVVRSRERDRLQLHLRARGIETLIHYPVPVPRQPALAARQPAACPKAEAACGEVLSLPLHPAMTTNEVFEVAGAVGDFQ